MSEDGEVTATFDTNAETMPLEVFPGSAPTHVEHCVKLAVDGYYDGATPTRRRGLEARRSGDGHRGDHPAPGVACEHARRSS